MKKISLKLTAVFVSAFIFFGGLAGSYIEGFCADVGYRFADTAWNYNDSIGENLYQYLVLSASLAGCYFDPTIISEDKDAIYTKLTEEFVDYLNSDKGIELTEGAVPQYFEDNISTVHESEDGTIHGGGGMVLSDDLVDALHHTAQAILDDQSGYILYPTFGLDNIPVSWFNSLDAYNAFLESLSNLKYIYILDRDYVSTFDSVDFFHDNIESLRTSSSSSYFKKLNSDWTQSSTRYDIYKGDEKVDSQRYSINSGYVLSDGNYSLFKAGYYNSDYNHYMCWCFLDSHFTSPDHCGYRFCTFDGSPLRIWYSLDAFKNFTLDRQPYYCTNEWINYDYSQDNSMTLTNTYLGNVVNGGVVNNYYNVVQDAIDENNTDGSLTEDQIRDIVADTIKQIQQDNNTESDSGGSGSDDNGSGGGIIAIIEGIGKFFDTLLTLVGNVIGMIADFGNSVLEMFGSLGTFTEGFSSFLSGTFGFIPEEVWKVLMSGITLSVLLLGIKFFK